MTFRYGSTTCPTCGKLRFLTKAEAKKSARRMKGRSGRLNAYRCGEFWHLGHLPKVVVAGRRSRDYVADQNDRRFGRTA